MMLATHVPCIRACFGQPRVPEEYTPRKELAVVNMVPWRMLWPVVGAIICLIVVLYIALQAGSAELFHVFWVCWVLGFIVLTALPTERITAAKSTNAGDKAPEGMAEI